MGDGRQGEVVDFSDAPQESTFGLNAEGGQWNDPGENAWTAAGKNIPLIAQDNNITEEWNKLGTSKASYFKGEWWQELFLTIQGLSTIAVNLIDAFEYGKAAAMAATGDVSDLVGAAAAAICKGLLDFLWESFQPLQDAVGVLLGNPDKIWNSRDMWVAVAQNLASLNETLSPELMQTVTENWQGAARDAATARCGDLVDTVAFASQSAGALGELLDVYGDMAEKINGTVRQFVADIVGAVVDALFDIAKYGKAAIIPIGIDLALLIARYVLMLIDIGIQMAWFIIAGMELLDTIAACFENSMSVLENLSGYTTG